MIKNTNDSGCYSSEGSIGSCCKVESIITVDERGQMVLPKELRDKIGIKAGDKMAVISFLQNDQVCCISLIKADNLAGMVKNLLGPMINEIS